MISEEIQNENELKKEYLKSYQALRRRACILQMEIDELEQLKKLPNNNTGVRSSGGSRDLSSYIVVLDERINEMVKLRYEKIEKYTEITRKIEKMEDENEKNVLTLYYIRGMTWEKVCEYMKYGWTQIHRIHGRALKNFKL